MAEGSFFVWFFVDKFRLSSLTRSLVLGLVRNFDVGEPRDVSQITFGSNFESYPPSLSVLRRVVDEIEDRGGQIAFMGRIDRLLSKSKPHVKETV